MSFNFDVQKFWEFADECRRRGFSQLLLSTWVSKGLTEVAAVLSAGFCEDEVRLQLTSQNRELNEEEAKRAATELGKHLREKAESLAGFRIVESTPSPRIV